MSNDVILSLHSLKMLPCVWLLQWVSLISCDVVIHMMCVVPVAEFQLANYELAVREISSCSLASPTVVRADLVTGAAIIDKYFPGSSSILRFQLLHVTRVHSLLRLDGRAPAVVVRALRDGLTNATSSSVGMCGIDDVSEDTSVVAPAASSWSMGLPALVAPVALIGWIITSCLCGSCWLYYYCVLSYTAETGPVPLAEVVHSALPLPSAPVQQPKIDPTGNSSARVPPKPPALESELTMDRVHFSIEFHPHPQSMPHRLDMRIPSFKASHNTKVFSDRISSFGAYSAA